MAATSEYTVRKYMIWTSGASGDFFFADSVIMEDDTVSFFLNGLEIKTYDKLLFLTHNPSWQLLENTD